MLISGLTIGKHIGSGEPSTLPILSGSINLATAEFYRATSVKACGVKSQVKITQRKGILEVVLEG